MTVLLLALMAAPTLTGPASALRVAVPALADLPAEVSGTIEVAGAGTVSGADVPAAQAIVTLNVEGVETRAEAYGFGDTAEAAADSAVAAAAQQAARALVGARAAKAPPSIDPQGGTLVELVGLSTFAAFDATLDFARTRDSKARIALLVGGRPTLHLPGTSSAAGFAAAARGYAPPEHVLLEVAVDDARVRLTFGPPPQAPPNAPPGPVLDAEDAPR